MIQNSYEYTNDKIKTHQLRKSIFNILESNIFVRIWFLLIQTLSLIRTLLYGVNILYLIHTEISMLRDQLYSIAPMI